MLIDALVHPLSKCEDMQQFWGKLDSGEDGALGIASSARPFMVAARFARTPQPTLVIIAGEEAADDFARNLGAYVGEERVLRFRERDDYPFGEKGADPRKVAHRMESLIALASGRECIVVASARSLLRKMPPSGNTFYQPLVFAVGSEAADMLPGDSASFEDIPLALESAGYANTGDLEGPGTYAVHGGTIDVYPGNLSYPVRIDFFGDEIDEIRRIVPTTGQTIATLHEVSVFPVREYAPSNRAIARARKALINPSKTNPVLRELLDKLEGGVTDAKSA